MALTKARELDLLTGAVSELVDRARFPIAFAGLEADGAVRISAIAGARTTSIDGLVVRASRGLGGRSLVERRPRITLNYRTARTFTHDYDGAILGEGISTLLAVPIMTGARTRGILYCGAREETRAGGVATRAAFAMAATLARELDPPAAIIAAPAEATPPESDASSLSAWREGLRETYAELRTISADVRDRDLRDRLAALESKLQVMMAPPGPRESTAGISPRELDVLAHTALGLTNAQIAARLGLRESTVKSYLAAAMGKLDAPTRLAAITKARREGILP
jgi:LuxR family transcriptional regulator, regulator of acetate metabolism